MALILPLRSISVLLELIFHGETTLAICITYLAPQKRYMAQ